MSIKKVLFKPLRDVSDKYYQKMTLKEGEGGYLLSSDTGPEGAYNYINKHFYSRCY